MLRIYLWLYIAFLYFPIAIIALFSFNSGTGLTFPIKGLGWRWYEAIFSNQVFISSFWNSVVVAVGSSLLTTLIGGAASLSMIRLKKRSKEWVSMLCSAPIGLPGLFLGIALVSLFAQVGIRRSLYTVVIAHVLYTLPFFIATMRSRIEYFDISCEEAARDLGATPWQTFRLVTLPILRPSMVGAAILCFALSFDEFIITVFVSGNDTTLPLMVWSMMRRTVDPSINAASMVALSVSLIIIAIGAFVFFMQRRAEVASRIKSSRNSADGQSTEHSRTVKRDEELRGSVPGIEQR